MVQFKLPQLKSVFPRTEMTRVEWCHGFLVPNLWLTPQQIFSERQWKISLALSKRCSKLYRIKKFPHDSWCKMNLGSNFGSFPALQKSLNAPFWVLFLSGVSLSNLWGVFCDFRAPMAVHEDFPKKLPRLRWSIYIYKYIYRIRLHKYRWHDDTWYICDRCWYLQYIIIRHQDRSIYSIMLRNSWTYTMTQNAWAADMMQVSMRLARTDTEQMHGDDRLQTKTKNKVWVRMV